MEPRAASTPGLLRRDRLLDQIDGGGRVIVLRAEGGAGKTTLASDWVHARGRGRLLVWVSLTEGEALPMPFWGRMLSTLGSALPDETGRRVLAYLDGLWVPDQAISLFVSTLMQQPREVMLVLDDLHLVSEEAQQQLLDTVRRVPSLRLLITTRTSSPFESALAKAAFDVAVIDSQQLSFTPAEIAAIANSLPEQIGKSELAALARISRGHTLATRLALAAMESLREQSGSRPDPAAVIRAMDTAVADLVPTLHDPEELRFALSIALCPEVDEALADILFDGKSDGDGGNGSDDDAASGWPLVRRFERLGLGRIAHVAGRPVFLMHTLVQSSLRRRALETLPADRVAEIRRTALDALRQLADPIDVIALMLASGLDEQVFPFFAAHYSRLSLYRTGEVAAMLDPLPRERFERTPELAITLSISMSEQARVPSPRVLELLGIAMPILEARAAVAARTDDEQPDVTAILVALARFAGMRSVKRYEETAELAEEFLAMIDRLPPEQQTAAWNPGKLQVLVTHLLAGDFERAAQLTVLLETEQHAGRIMHMHSLQALVHALLEDFDGAQRHLDALGSGDRPGWTGSLYAHGWHLAHALLCERRGEIEQGFEHLKPFEGPMATFEQWPVYVWVRGRLLLRSDDPGAAAEYQMLLRRNSDRPISRVWRQRLDSLREEFLRTAMPEPLSERETTVLAQLDGVSTLAEIAKGLHVSTNTLKTQTRSIYRKLGVAGRDEAVQRAKRLGLLPEHGRG